MDKLLNVLIYLMREYPHKQELSNARLTKMVYLADWLSAIRRNQQITDIQWYFDNYGPFVHDIFTKVADHGEIFNVDCTQNMYGGEKNLIQLKDDNINVELPQDEKEILDYVIDTTKTMYWNDFIKLIYSTYPIISSDRYNFLDLTKKAQEYQEI